VLLAHRELDRRVRAGRWVARREYRRPEGYARERASETWTLAQGLPNGLSED